MLCVDTRNVCCLPSRTGRHDDDLDDFGDLDDDLDDLDDFDEFDNDFGSNGVPSTKSSLCYEMLRLGTRIIYL